MKNLYFVPFYYDGSKQSGININNSGNKLDTYLSNCCVSLVSARIKNPTCDIALVTNLTDIPKKYFNILKNANIKTIIAPFDSFSFPNEFKWSAAFYKLCALKHITNNYKNYYENILYTDSDVFCQLPFDPIWDECADDKILLFDLCESKSNSLYMRFCKEIEFTGLKHPIHYGGEFYAASMENAHLFINECLKFYKTIITNNLVFDSGDELIISAVANNNRNVKNAGAYIYRFWTGIFRITTSRCLFNPVVLLHCPDQKEKGFIKLFNYYIRNKSFPNNKKVLSYLRLRKTAMRDMIVRFLSVFITKYRNNRIYE